MVIVLIGIHIGLLVYALILGRAQEPADIPAWVSDNYQPHAELRRVPARW